MNSLTKSNVSLIYKAIDKLSWYLDFAMSCLHSLMDIYPSHIPTLIGQNLIENLSEAMEAAAAFGLEDMN